MRLLTVLTVKHSTVPKLGTIPELWKKTNPQNRFSRFQKLNKKQKSGKMEMRSRKIHLPIKNREMLFIYFYF